VPVGFLLASAETEEMYELFLRTLLAGVRWHLTGLASRPIGLCSIVAGPAGLLGRPGRTLTATLRRSPNRSQPPPARPHLQAREAGDGTFKYKFVMIDKSKTEIAAVNVLAAEGLACSWLLCYFHFLQEWERFLVSKESGVEERADRHMVLVMLARLAHIKERAVFEAEVSNTAAGSALRCGAALRRNAPHSPAPPA